MLKTITDIGFNFNTIKTLNFLNKKLFRIESKNNFVNKTKSN